MKITKRQLRRIIKEEKKLLKESVADMVDLDDVIVGSSTELASVFGDLMMELFDEDPAMFSGRSTKEEWAEQVDAAVITVGAYIEEGIIKGIERAESMLHDGQFRDLGARGVSYPRRK